MFGDLEKTCSEILAKMFSVILAKTCSAILAKACSVILAKTCLAIFGESVFGDSGENVFDDFWRKRVRRFLEKQFGDNVGVLEKRGRRGYGDFVLEFVMK